VSVVGRQNGVVSKRLYEYSDVSVPWTR